MKTLALDISFSRDYFTKNFGIQYGRGYFEDVRSRAETDQAVKRALYDRFGDIGMGDPDPDPIVQLGYDDTLNVTLMFGGELQLGGDIAWVEPGFLSAETIENMSCPVIEETWPHTDFIKQFDEAVNLFGPGSVRPPVPHGILEAAMDLRSSTFLEDLVVEPERAERLLEVLTETIIRVKEFWDLKCYGEIRKGLSLGTCSTAMLSAETVSRFLVPRYSRIARRFGDAFVCCCGVGTHNLENFAAIEGVRYVRVGWGTDLAKTAEVLREHYVKAGLDVVRAATLSADEFERDVRHILETLEPVDHVSVLLIHAGAETPDENIHRLAATALDFARKNNVRLENTSTCSFECEHQEEHNENWRSAFHRDGRRLRTR